MALCTPHGAACLWGQGAEARDSPMFCWPPCPSRLLGGAHLEGGGQQARAFRATPGAASLRSSWPRRTTALAQRAQGGPAGCGRVLEIAGDGDSPQRDQPQAPSARALPWKWSFRVLLVRPTSDAQICPLKEKSGRRRPRHGAGHPSRAERVCGLVLMKGLLYPGTPRLQPPQALGASQQPGSPSALERSAFRRVLRVQDSPPKAFTLQVWVCVHRTGHSALGAVRA